MGKPKPADAKEWGFHLCGSDSHLLNSMYTEKQYRGFPTAETNTITSSNGADAFTDGFHDMRHSLCQVASRLSWQAQFHLVLSPHQARLSISSWT